MSVLNAIQCCLWGRCYDCCCLASTCGFQVTTRQRQRVGPLKWNGNRRFNVAAGKGAHALCLESASAYYEVLCSAQVHRYKEMYWSVRPFRKERRVSLGRSSGTYPSFHVPTHPCYGRYICMTGSTSVPGGSSGPIRSEKEDHQPAAGLLDHAMACFLQEVRISAGRHRRPVVADERNQLMCTAE